MRTARGMTFRSNASQRTHRADGSTERTPSRAVESLQQYSVRRGGESPDGGASHHSGESLGNVGAPMGADGDWACCSSHRSSAQSYRATPPPSGRASSILGEVHTPGSLPAVDEWREAVIPVGAGGLNSSSSSPSGCAVFNPRSRAQLSGRQLQASMRLATERAIVSTVSAPPRGTYGMNRGGGGGGVLTAADIDTILTGGFDAHDEAEEVTTGWVTLKKHGHKLVSSRLRLDTITRQQYRRQWERQVQHEKQRDREAQAIIEGAALNTLPVPAAVKTDRAVDAAVFAFGGISPGVLHAHGKLYDTHKASYSIGVAGTYLLHVRLRQQAKALPGSPFVLTVHPANAHASQTFLPSEVLGAVGGECTMVIETGDLMENKCIRGGADIRCYCGDDRGWKERLLLQSADADKKEASSSSTAKAKKDAADPEAVEAAAKAAKAAKEQPTATVVDRGDGSYHITWHSVRTGTFRACVRINGIHVGGSPTRLLLSSCLPDIRSSEVSGEGTRTCVKAEQASIRVQFFDTGGNRTIQTRAFRTAFSASVRTHSYTAYRI